jgi:ABC-2 type transport system permease protein
LPYEAGEWLRALGSGSRFESITRGVLDLRDIFYYLTIVVLFLLLTRIKLESLRWPNHFSKKARNKWLQLTAVVVISLLITNIGLSFVTQARIDLTQGNIYSLSNATKQYLGKLEKPLLIRGYFSSSTHPLLAPLIPRLRDLLNEYAVLGSGNVKVEFIDPLDESKFEEEAGMKYGVRPVSFHSESKYQASVINTYFNVLIAYEDQYEVLNYKDLVELKASANKHEVDLNNPEYQITRAIRSIASKVNRQVSSFKELTDPLALTGYVSSRDLLPKNKQKITELLNELSEKFRQQSDDNFDVLFINPDEDQLTQEYLRNELRVRPISDSELSTQPYWFYFTLTDGKKTVPVSFSREADKTLLSQSIFAAYKRLLPDSVKTVAFMRPLATPGPAGVIESPGIPKHFSILRKSLEQSVQVVDVDLRDGVVPKKVDFLMVFAPRYLNPVQISAIQNYLTSGGTVLIASSPIDVNVSHFTEVYSVQSGLENWLEDLGISIKNTLVLDNQHGKYSLPVIRQAGNLRVRETNLVNYPYVIDVRGDGLNTDIGITSKLGQLFVPWSSPIMVNPDKNKDRTVTPLLFSSKESWTSDNKDIIPNFELHPEIGFAQPDEKDTAYLLGTMIEGSFGEEITNIDSSRLIVIGSSLLFTDNFSDQMSQILRNEYRRPIQLMQNLVSWSLEDQELLNVLRKHTQFTRTLTTLDEKEKSFWEYLNYTLGAVGLLLIGVIRIILSRKSRLRGIKLLHG